MVSRLPLLRTANFSRELSGMKILIIEDDESKVKDIQDVVGEVFDCAVVAISSSYQSGLLVLSNLDVDLVILDMTLPLYDETGAGGGGRKVQFGGELILREMVQENMSQPVIIVSQHDYFADYVSAINLSQLGERLRDEFGKKVIDTILYDSSEFVDGAEQGWRKQLKDAIIVCQSK